VLRRWYAKISEKITISGGLVDKIIEIYAIIAVARKFGSKRGCFSGLKAGRRALQNYFWTAMAKDAA
jgi:hypothetical protein